MSKVWWLVFIWAGLAVFFDSEKYNRGRCKVMDAYLQLSYNFEPTFLHWPWIEEYCQTSPNKNQSPNLWHLTSILVCCIFDYAQTWPPDVKNLKKVASNFCKVLVNLTGWKTELLIAQLRAGIWQKVFRLKTYPQGVLPAR